jgi:hypothetical protein
MARKGRKKQRGKTSKTERGRMKEKQSLPLDLCMLLEVELKHKRSEEIKAVFFVDMQIDLAVSVRSCEVLHYNTR